MVTLDDISPHVKLSIGNDEANAVFGRGVAMLCRGVRDDGSTKPPRTWAWPTAKPGES